MTTLHDRLAELADEAPVALPAPGLWERGRRYGRVRRTGTAAIVVAACLALVVLSGVSWLQSVPPSRPAPAGSPVGLPDRIWQPSPWLPGTDSEGPLGQLVAVVSTDRGGWFGKDRGLVGISATTGEYRFLDLPDAVHDAFPDATLAPNGRHLAYWLTGETAGSPNTGGGAPVVGVGVYDTATGAVRRHLIPTEHGLTPEILVWADESSLVFSAGQILGGDDDSLLEQSQSKNGSPLVWSIEARPRVLDLDGLDGNNILSAVDGRLVVDDSYDGVFRIVDLDDPAADRRFVTIDNLSTMPLLDAGGRRVAAVWGGPAARGTSMPNAVLAGPLVPRAAGQTEGAELKRVPHSGQTFSVLAWLDDTHLAVVRRTNRCCSSAVFRVSVPTGDSVVLVRLPVDSFGSDVRFATDLLNAPSVHAERPQSPLDPRLVAGLALATAGVTVWALVRWRRRVQP